MKKQTRAQTNTIENIIFNICKNYYNKSQAIDILLNEANDENEYNKILQFKQDLDITFLNAIIDRLEPSE